MAKSLDKNSLLYEVYDYPVISSYETKVKKQLDNLDIFKNIPLISLVDTSSFLGIEVEVEGIKNVGPMIEFIQPCWNVVEDRSLRNNGMEFVSIPIRGEHVYKSLVLLKYFLFKLNKPVFSERTSVHIHMNVRRLSLEKLFIVVLTYLITEKVLFKYIESCGFTRENNIFCSPVTDSKYYLHLNEIFNLWEEGKYDGFLSHLRSLWRKYTAFNLLPLKDKGTVEFRHLGGTLDIPVIMNWINLILCVKKYSYTTSLDKLLKIIETLNIDSTYHGFLDSVFGRYSQLLWGYNTDRTLEEGIKSVKQCIVWSKKKQDYPNSYEQFRKSSYGKYFESLGGKVDTNKNPTSALRQKLEALKYEKREIEKNYQPDKDKAGIIANKHSELSIQIAELEKQILMLENVKHENTKD